MFMPIEPQRRYTRSTAAAVACLDAQFTQMRLKAKLGTRCATARRDALALMKITAAKNSRFVPDKLACFPDLAGWTVGCSCHEPQWIGRTGPHRTRLTNSQLKTATSTFYPTSACLHAPVGETDFIRQRIRCGSCKNVPLNPSPDPMSYKRSRATFEADLHAPYALFGTPLPDESDGRDDGSYLPLWKQDVRDDKGRRRLHGAFTGGWSAG